MRNDECKSGWNVIFGGRVSSRAAFRCAEGWSQVSLRSAGRDERRSSGRRFTPPHGQDARATSSHPSRGALGGASVCLPADEQTLVPPQRRSRRHPVKKSLRLRVSALKNRRSVGTKCCSAFSPLHKPFIRLAERREGRALLVRAAFYAAITGKMPVPHSPVPVLCNKGTGV